MKTFLAFLLSLVLMASVAKTIPVGKGQVIRSIKEAIEMASAFDTIAIQPGIYKEGNIVIEKSLHIVGVNWPVLDGEHKHEIFTIHANKVQVTGIEFRNTGVASINDVAGVKVLDSKHVKIVGNRFINNFFGVHFSNSSHSYVSNNFLEASATAEHQVGNGIHMWQCHHMTITGNTIKGHRDGMYYEFVTNSTMRSNVSEGNLRYGLHFMFSHDDEYINNSFLHNGAGVAVMYTKGVKMIGNTFEHNWGPSSYGLLLKDIRDSFVQDNRFRFNSVAIFMEGSSRIQFTRNIFDSNGYAIRLQASCDGNTITTNNFVNNTFDLATNGSLVLNDITANYWDKYEGYDLNRNNVGDVAYHPVSMYSMVVERMPSAVLLWRSFLVFLLDRAEKAIPVITPENLRDEQPQMKPYDLH